jgi:hypothetical protein
MSVYKADVIELEKRLRMKKMEAEILKSMGELV